MFYLASTFNVFSQDYRWRDHDVYRQKQRILKHSMYGPTTYDYRVDFRNTLFSSNAYFNDTGFDSIADFSDAKFDSIADFYETTFISSAIFRKAKFASLVWFKDSEFASPVDFSDAKFASYAGFSWARFASTSDFSNAKFYSPTDFSYVKFDSTTDFSGAKFESTAYFKVTIFYSRAIFKEVEFVSTANFLRARFGSPTDFSNAKFSSIANFFRARFASTTDFSNAQFDSTANFSKVRFYSTADFSYAKFYSTDFSRARFFSIANFNSVKFDSSFVSFAGTHFDSLANFVFAEFDSLADFSQVKFNFKVDFSAATLPKYLNLSEIDKILGRIDLTEAYINPKYDICFINLFGSDVRKIKLRYSGFKLDWPENEDLLNSKNGTFLSKEDSINWVEEKKLEIYNTKLKIYEDLMDFQKKEGYARSYEILDKEYKRFKYTGDFNPFGFWWGGLRMRVHKYWWGYGYDRSPVIRNVILIYLLFSLINTFMLRHLTNKVYEAPKINEWWIEVQGSKVGIFIKSIPFSLFYTAQIFFGFKFDVDKLKYKENLQGLKNFNLLYFFFMYFVGLISLLYVFNFVLKF